MKAIQLLTATAALAVVAATAHSASAAAAAAAPAAAPRPAAAAPAAPAAGSVALTPPPGAPIPGMCVFSLERAIGESTVGKAFNARMQQITAQAEAELAPERTALQTEATTLQGQQASLAADAFQQRATALNQRIQAYSAKEDLRSREIDATQQKNLQRIAVEVNPLLAGVYTARRCAVVFTAEALINVNPAMDISDDVTKSLNGKMTTIAFDRERLDQQAVPAPAAAAARPR
ncbi:MAG TPA: OmpH family outer membrane protein [Caulobacteraceae bacterium]|jgi:outer membrane protein|nr:OmpH family outer membrane protein [Caulobacteraceae bacterium]